MHRSLTILHCYYVTKNFYRKKQIISVAKTLSSYSHVYSCLSKLPILNFRSLYDFVNLPEFNKWAVSSQTFENQIMNFMHQSSMRQIDMNFVAKIKTGILYLHINTFSIQFHLLFTCLRSYVYDCYYLYFRSIITINNLCQIKVRYT